MKSGVERVATYSGVYSMWNKESGVELPTDTSTDESHSISQGKRNASFITKARKIAYYLQNTRPSCFCSEDEGSLKHTANKIRNRSRCPLEM
jgi:hypothetical protein